jgi:hypothetical protein
VVPTRYGAGVKTKTIEALQYGVPVVATTIGAEGLIAPNPEIVAIADDPVLFAERVVSLYSEEPRWNAARDAIRAFVTARNVRAGGAWVDAVIRAQRASRSASPTRGNPAPDRRHAKNRTSLLRRAGRRRVDARFVTATTTLSEAPAAIRLVESDLHWKTLLCTRQGPCPCVARCVCRSSAFGFISRA